MSRHVTIEDAVALLNELLTLDYDAIHAMVSARFSCNDRLADHPTVQVRGFNIEAEEHTDVGLLGILNGLLAEPEQGKFIAMVEDEETGEIKKFKIISLIITRRQRERRGQR